MAYKGFVGSGTVGHFATTTVLELQFPAQLYAGRMATVEVVTGSATHYFSDGLSWKPQALLATDPLTGKNVGVWPPAGSGYALGLNGFVPATNDYAGILAAFNAAVAAGGGVVQLLPITYNIGGNTLPRASGVSYIGVAPKMLSYIGAGLTAAPDIGDIVFANGTVINGNGSNIAMASQTTGGATFVGSVSTVGGGTLTVTSVSVGSVKAGMLIKDISGGTVATNSSVIAQLTGTPGGAGTYSVSVSGTTASTTINGFDVNVVSNSNVKNIGFTNVSQALVSGSKDSLGDAWSTFENLYCNASTGVPFDILNFEHITVQNLRSFACGSGPRIAMYSSTTQWGGYGNSTVKSVYDYKNGLPYAKGMILGSSDANTLTACNDMLFEDIQANHYNRPLVTQVATCTGVANITVTTGSQFPVDMPVTFSASTGNIIGGTDSNGMIAPAYFVISQVANVIQVSATPGGTAIIPGTATPNISQQGFPLLTASGNFALTSLDCEGASMAPVLLNGASGFINKAAYALAGGPNFVVRNSQYFTFILGGTPSIDVCAQGSNNQIYATGGTITPAQSSVLFGLYQTNKFTACSINLASNRPSDGAQSFSNRSPGNGDFTYPGLPVGVRQSFSNATGASGWNLGDLRAGFATYSGAGTATWTFGQGIGSGMQGFRQTFKNQGTGALTITLGASDGTFDGMTGGTSLGKSFLLAAPTATAAGGVLTIVCCQTGSSTYQWGIESLVNATLV